MTPAGFRAAGKAPGADGSGERYGAFAYVYDRLMADMPYGEWHAWLDLYWTKHGRPRTVVDLACGTGAIALPLAREGLRVVGIDLSPDMIEVARRKEAALRAEVSFSGEVEWLVGDMRGWSLPELADSIVSMCDGLNYLTDEADLARAFAAAHAGLREGGAFLFDMHHPNQLDVYLENEPFCLDDEDVSYIWSCTEEAADTVTHRLTLFIREEDGRYVKNAETHRQRMYPERTVRRLLKEAGFARVESFSDFSFEPVDDAETLRMFFAAVK